MTQPDAEEVRAGRPGLLETKLGTVLVLVVTLAVVLLGAYLLMPKSSGTQADGVTPVDLGAQSGPAPVVGQPAGDFRATTIDGKPVSLSQFRGKPVWLAFNASWCAPCRVEAPDIEAAYKREKASGLVILAVYLREDAATVRDFTTRLGLTYTHVPDPDTRISASYRVAGVPSHYFIGRDGVIRAIQVGILDRAKMDAALGQIRG